MQVRLRNVDMAIEFGQTVLGPAVRTAQDQELLQVGCPLPPSAQPPVRGMQEGTYWPLHAGCPDAAGA